MGFTVNTILEGDEVSSWNGLLDPLHIDEGRWSGEGGENEKSEYDELLGEHLDAGRCARGTKGWK